MFENKEEKNEKQLVNVYGVTDKSKSKL